MAEEWSKNAERIAILEAEIRHINRSIDAMAEQVKEMHEMLLKAKGAKWAVYGIIAVASFISGKVGGVLVSIFTGVKIP